VAGAHSISIGAFDDGCVTVIAESGDLRQRQFYPEEKVYSATARRFEGRVWATCPHSDWLLHIIALRNRPLPNSFRRRLGPATKGSRWKWRISCGQDVQNET
jgi:hypothetical protein